MNTLFQEIRYALRMLGKSPGLTLAAIACIGLGIGSTTTIFSTVNAILLRPFGFTDPDRIVAVHTTQTLNDIDDNGLSYPVYRELMENKGPFADIAAFTGRSLTLTGGEEPERVFGLEVSARLFPLLGVQPILGRQFTDEEDRPGGPGAILLSHTLWMRRFNGDPNVVGRSIVVNNRSSTIVGVMPAGFEFIADNLAWIPLAPFEKDKTRPERNLAIYARLRPGITEDQARAEMQTFAARLAKEHPEEQGWGADVRTLRRELVGKGMRQMVLTLMGMVLFVLLIACSNVANLFLARVGERGRELALRTALGSGRGRLVRQVLLEGLLVACAGGLLGIGLAYLGIRWIILSIPAAHALPYWIRFTIDGRVLAFTAAASIATGILFALAPALSATGGDLQARLKAGGRGEAGSRGRLRNGLIVAEIALALVLLIGAALMVRTFLAVRNADTGIGIERMLTLRIYLPGAPYEAPGAKARRVEEIARRLEALPGVEAVGASNLIPLGGGGGGGPVEIDGKPAERGHEPRIFWAAVTDHFLAASSVALASGRTFTTAEETAKAPLAVVNQAFVRKHWPNLDPLGRRFRLLEEEGQPWITVIGVVPDFAYDGLGQQNEGILPAAFLPYPWMETPNTGFSIRTRNDPASVAAAARREIHAADPGLPVFDVLSMREVWRSATWEQRFFGAMFSVFAGIALILAGIGIYGVLSHLVGLRRREIGVRVALGARRAQVLRMVVRQGFQLALLGLVIGVPAALGLTRVLSRFLWGVAPYDPVSFASIAALLGSVALFASYLPATRATRVDPIEALRSE